MADWAISGGSGFLGLHLARRLLSGGENVRTLDLVPLETGLAALGARGIEGDIRSPRAAAELCRGADVLVHAAASLPIRGSPRELRSIAVDGTATLLAAALESNVRRVVFVSSAVVYGLPRSLPLTEETPPAPFEAYGRAKLEAEGVCRAFGRRGLEVVVVRPTAFIGPGRLGVFGILFEWIRQGRRIYTLGRGANRYQLLAVEDLVDAILLAATRPVAGQTFVLGAPEVDSVDKELRALIQYAGSLSRPASIPAGLARPLLALLARLRLSPLSEWHYRTADRDFYLDASKARRELGWQPSFSNLHALVRSYDWYAANRETAEAGTTHRSRWGERALAVMRRVS